MVLKLELNTHFYYIFTWSREVSARSSGPWWSQTQTQTQRPETETQDLTKGLETETWDLQHWSPLNINIILPQGLGCVTTGFQNIP